MISQDQHSFRNQLDRFLCCDRFRFEQEISKPLNIGERAPGINQLRQDLIPGLEATLPFARDRMYA